MTPNFPETFFHKGQTSLNIHTQGDCERGKGKHDSGEPNQESEDFFSLLPSVRNSPKGDLRLSYDEDADVLYIQFHEAARTTDSELTDDDIIVRYDGDEVIGITILHAIQP